MKTENKTSHTTKPAIEVEPVLASVIISWISVDEKLPLPGLEVLLFNKMWKNNTYNKTGMRIGFLDSFKDWTVASWVGKNYITLTSSKDYLQLRDTKKKDQTPPTHWMNIMPCDV